MNGLPVDRQTFVGADEATHRGLQYDLLVELCRRIDETHGQVAAMPQGFDRRYVSWRWVKDKKLLLTGFVVGWGVANGMATWGVLKLANIL